MTSATLLGVLLAIWAQGLTIFSPGKISARSSRPAVSSEFQNHADFESACERCHQPLQAIQASLCLDCHTQVANQVNANSGTHARIIDRDQCANCHPDHRGRDFDLLSLGFQRFDHNATNFDLIHHQVSFDSQPLNCQSCHSEGQFNSNFVSCDECHLANNPIFMTNHQENFGQDCLACHDGLDSMATFDHSVNTEFPLLGDHQVLICSGCHKTGDFQNTTIECAGCHQEPPLHQGLFDMNCAACHTPADWSPVSFEETNFSHQTSTRFSLAHHALDYSGTPLTCDTCHTGENWTSAPQICLDCHLEEGSSKFNQHVSEFGTRCLDCHDGIDRMREFDHENYFILDGNHASVACGTCHKEQVWVDTNSACISCHEDPELHFGVFGQQCQYCHIAEGWVPAPLRRHPFPLDHGTETASTCETCHQDTYSNYSCYSCHEHNQEEIESGHAAEGIPREKVDSCFTCHSNGEIEESR